MAALTVRLEDPLRGTLDPDAIAQAIPKTFIVKGMFFTRLTDALGDDYKDVEPKLESAPRSGRYLAFSDYLQSDYVRVSIRAAKKAYPELGLREALRRLGRDDFTVFAASTFGKIMLSVVGDVRSALLRAPAIYKRMAPGEWTVVGEEVDDATIRLVFDPVYGTWEYILGQLEGIVMTFSKLPVTTVNEPEARKLVFDVCYGGS